MVQARDTSSGPKQNPTQASYLEVDCSLNHSMNMVTCSTTEFLLIIVFISTFPIKETFCGIVYKRIPGQCTPCRGLSHYTNVQ